MMQRNVSTMLGCDADFDSAASVLFGAPMDMTTSFRPGARFGPSAMRELSFGMETYSPYQDKDLTDIAVMDSGDLELPMGDAAAALGMIEERAAIILNHGKRPVMLGGEHLVTLGAVRAAAKKHPDLHILHFDAHADLREDYLGVKLSHACVIRRCQEILGDGRIYQFGIRSGDREEFIWGKSHVHTRLFDFGGLDEVIAHLKDKPVYLTIDLDVLDPAVFPGTGTPESGGVDFISLLGAIRSVCRLNIVAADLNELCPDRDHSGASTMVALKILRELLLAF